MLSYVQLRSWRSLCEFLEKQPYKFAEPEAIASGAGVLLKKIYAKDGVEHRRLLKDLYLISFIRWGEHPILTYQNSRRIRQTYRGTKGWILIAGWEQKIYFLEQVYLLKVPWDQIEMPWHEASRQYHLEKYRQKRQQLKKYLDARRTFSAKVRSRILNERCWNCDRPMMALMVDCVCGAAYDGWTQWSHP